MKNSSPIRINYLDVCKGLLILAVVIMHLLMPLKANVPEHPVIKTIYFCGLNTFVLFYMPAFYIVSGICSNYEKSFSSFLISKIISLKIPIFFFIGIPGCLGIWTLYGFSPFDIKLWIIRMFESGPWFLHAIFLSQILIYVIKRLVANQTLQFIVCIILYTIGGIGIINHLYPCFWIFHSLMLTIFLLIGKVTTVPLKWTNCSLK